jgi:hypothetical protein
VSCSAQKQVVEMVQCSKGNTGYKGRVPKEYENRPNTGHDFYTISIKVYKKCVIEVLDLTVKKNEQDIILKPVMEDGTTKMSFLADETCYLRAELDAATPSVLSKKKLKNEGFLTLKVNGKTTKLEVKSFESILPQ